MTRQPAAVGFSLRRATALARVALLCFSATSCASYAYLAPTLTELAPDRVSATDLTQRRSIRFLVFGDSGTGGVRQQEVADAMSALCVTGQAGAGGCDFALVLGDNIYNTGTAPPVTDH